MPTLVTVAQLREHVETDLVDAAVQRLLDDADAEIVRRLGPAASQVEVLEGGGKFLHLARQAASVTSAVERLFSLDGALIQEVTLSASDHKLAADGYLLERLTTGPNSYHLWRGMVTLTYVPNGESAQRIRLEVDLVKLAIRYEAVAESSVGDVSTVHLEDYQAERGRLFRSLSNSGRRLVT